MSKVIHMQLSEGGIESAIKQIEEYKSVVADKTERLVKRLSDEGVSRAKANVSRMDTNGSLGWIKSALQVVDVHRLGHTSAASIACLNGYAIFVEMGTGFMGRGSVHPVASELGWRYDVNGHGKKGWWYPTSASDPNPIKREYNGRLYAWTAGMPARPFMHQSYTSLKKDLHKTAREVFAE